ncbi:MAG: hypothetical protein ACNA8W_26460, partial [Bradymonadaceae bacterium]
AASEVCKSHGECSASSPSSLCRPSREEHCEQSTLCKKDGLCGLASLSTYHICEATRPEHCSQSELCKNKGYCHFRNGVCEKAEDL